MYIHYYIHYFVFFFKQKTAYEMRISDWSSDVCSSDLLKSAAFAECLSWQTGVPPEELAAVDFRVKDPDQPANRYRFGAKAKNADDWRTLPTSRLLGGNWGHGIDRKSTRLNSSH